jgi:hypothetical protein
VIRDAETMRSSTGVVGVGVVVVADMGPSKGVVSGAGGSAVTRPPRTVI